MHSRIRDRLTYANVVSTLALIVAVAGGSTAIAISAKKAPRNSVVAKSIKPGNVAAKQLSGLVVAQARTPVADVGVAGDGLHGEGTATAICPEGARAITGGGIAGGGLGSSLPSGTNGWGVGGRVPDVFGGGEVTAFVYCLPVRPLSPKRLQFLP